MQAHKGLIIAHRGESYDAPENTLAAIKLAWERGADAVEVDIHLSREGEIVVIHDDTLWRTARRFGRVARKTLAQLKRLDVGKFKGERWRGERIPTLGEVIATVPEQRRLFVEVKANGEMPGALSRTLGAYPISPTQLALIGKDLKLMGRLKGAFPEHESLWVCAVQDEKKGGAALLAAAKAAGLDGIDVRVGDWLDQGFMRRAKEADMKVYVWTVNDPEEARRLFAWGVDGVTTDRAGWLRDMLAGS